MKRLPDLLRRLPVVFYVLAALLFVWNLGNQWFTLSEMGQYGDPTLEGVFAYQKSVALYGAVVEAAYMIANGGLLHLLLSIYDKMQGPAE